MNYPHPFYPIMIPNKPDENMCIFLIEGKKSQSVVYWVLKIGPGGGKTSSMGNIFSQPQAKDFHVGVV